MQWLPPAAYRRWRDVGLRGYIVAGLPSPGFRGRWAAERNGTFVALARRVGLTNATFCRYFTDVAREVAAAGRNESQAEPVVHAPSRLQDLERQNPELRRTDRDLTLTVKLAEAAIQRFALENHRLRQELEAATRVTRLDDKRRNTPAPPPTRT